MVFGLGRTESSRSTGRGTLKAVPAVGQPVATIGDVVWGGIWG